MGLAISTFQSGRRCWTRQLAMSLSSWTTISTHSRFASSGLVPGGATLIERIRALFASTGLKSLTDPNASIRTGTRAYDGGTHLERAPPRAACGDRGHLHVLRDRRRRDRDGVDLRGPRHRPG